MLNIAAGYKITDNVRVIVSPGSCQSVVYRVGVTECHPGLARV